MKTFLSVSILCTAALFCRIDAAYSGDISGSFQMTVHAATDVISGVVLPRDTNLIITASLDGSLNLTNTLKKEQRLLSPISFASGMCAPVYNSFNDYFGYYDGQRVIVQKLADWTSVRDLSSSPTTAIAISSDGLVLATASSNGYVHVLNMDTGLIISNLHHFESPVTAMALKDDGETIALGMDNGTVEFWNYRSTTMLSTIPGYAAPVASIKFIPGNRQYVISDIRGLIKVRNIPHDDLSSSAAGTVRGASSIEAAPNGSGFFYLASDTVIRFRTRTGVDALELKSHGGKLTSLSISPDGSMLAAASTQGEVYLYRIKGIETVVRKAIIKVLRNPGLSTADLLRPDAMETKLTTGMLEGIVLSDVPLRILRINEQPNPLTLLNSVPSGVTDTDRIYNYSFQYPFTIRFKYIDIVLESVDLLNGKTSKAVTIELEEPDTLKPEMFTLQPDDSVLAKEFPSKDSLPVQTLFSGLVSDNKGIKSFTVNGNGCVLTEPYPEDYKKATISEATMTGVVKKFETNVSLRVGKNTFELLAVDINNNKTIDTFRIYRQEPKPDSIVTQASPVPTALPKTWAVVIGVSKYANPEWNLKYADKDAELFYKFLKTKAGGEIPDSRIKLLLNSEATRENILAQVAEKLEMAHTGERVILYFAAHGMMGGKGELFFLGSNSDPDLIRFTGVPVRDIEDEIQSAVADVVVISDACHAGASSGEGFRGLMASEINYQLAQIAGTKKGVVWFSSSTANELSQEGPQWDGHGVFTKFLVDGLKGAADADKDNRITIVELEDYVKDKVRDATLGKQRPLVGGYHPDNMILSITK